MVTRYVILLFSDLSTQVAELQAQLKIARLQEFEAQEAAVEAASELEIEREKRKAAEAQLEHLKNLQNSTDRVLKLEVAGLKEECQKEREIAQRMKVQADTVGR